MLGNTVYNLYWRAVSHRRITNTISTCAGIFTAGNLEKPVFVVGTGRCGTSLLVEIFDSHPQLAGFPDEANDLWHPNLYPYDEATLDVPPIEADPAGFTRASLASWPPGHPDRIRRVFSGFHLLAGRNKVFFSKSAMTSFMIPTILKLFPDARFLHIYRSGPSVVQSYTKKNFGTYSRYHVEMAVYQTLCAKYWNDCILEIEARRKTLKLEERGMFAELGYEAFCESPSKELKKLADFLGVDPTGFTFDLGTVKSTNYKAGLTPRDDGWETTLTAMQPALRLKGYVV